VLGQSVGPAFSVQHVPFSYAGSWFGISPVVAERRYAEDLHLVSHQTRMHAVLRFVPLRDGHRVPAAVTATAARLRWQHEDGCVDIAYERADTVRVRGEGLGLRLLAADAALTPFTGAYFYREPADDSYVFTVYETGRRYRVTVLTGEAQATGSQALGSTERGIELTGTSPWELAIEEYRTARAPYRSTRTHEQVVRAAAAEFETFLDAVAPWRSHRTPAAALAAYVLWSAQVEPAGFLTRPAVLMSKHWMDKVWSWDHCLNALALAEGVPDLAWHQYRLPFDHQDSSGALPDSVAHSEVLHNFVKPPIHGWTLRRLRERLPALVPHDELLDTYHQLARWTDFWLTHRRRPGDPLPYYQHGNDSGWDNATTFDPQRLIQAADLPAHLILQASELAELAGELGRRQEAARWSATADELTTALLERLWDGERFVSVGMDDGRSWTTSSLLDLTPVVLGERLPQPVRDALAARIATHLTPYGLATEHPDSPHYEQDGYWRGPVWAPPTILVEDGLRRGGHAHLADRVSARYRALCEQSGFAENFNATTGEGLRDRAYTWTASAYLLLAAAYERRLAAPD
jgi:glycogen debranching enzyme